MRLLRFLEHIQNLFLTSAEKWRQTADRLGGCFLMPYDKNKTACQDEAWFEREQRKELISNLEKQTCISAIRRFLQIVDEGNSSFYKQALRTQIKT